MLSLTIFLEFFFLIAIKCNTIIFNLLFIFQEPYNAVYYDKISSLLAYYIDLKLMSSQ